MNEKRRAVAVRRLPYPGQFQPTKHDLVKAGLLSGLTVDLGQTVSTEERMLRQPDY